MTKYVLRRELDWAPALGARLSDHPWGSICRTRKGHEYLIGDAEEGCDESGGCSCCRILTIDSMVVEYAIAISIQEGLK